MLIYASFSAPASFDDGRADRAPCLLPEPTPRHNFTTKPNTRAGGHRRFDRSRSQVSESFRSFLHRHKKRIAATITSQTTRTASTAPPMNCELGALLTDSLPIPFGRNGLSETNVQVSGCPRCEPANRTFPGLPLPIALKDSTNRGRGRILHHAA